MFSHAGNRCQKCCKSFYLDFYSYHSIRFDIWLCLCVPIIHIIPGCGNICLHFLCLSSEMFIFSLVWHGKWYGSLKILSFDRNYCWFYYFAMGFSLRTCKNITIKMLFKNVSFYDFVCVIQDIQIDKYTCFNEMETRDVYTFANKITKEMCVCCKWSSGFSQYVKQYFRARVPAWLNFSFFQCSSTKRRSFLPFHSFAMSFFVLDPDEKELQKNARTHTNRITREHNIHKCMDRLK